ncbi:putative ABC transport system permease protein [Marininema mesophilum]|uniref:Putative ABC transport system permease protein n=1 Tax=Marininema mesophilum TaxID=1048340 RepID=A0A1H3BJC4_9BACL|nr:FtsX-like permease family protein [Marininema mesophilum]SDX42052.1 putative ABC transport system permease protein [Marininema mesophilum]
MNKQLYRKLALTNLKKNASMMLPYLITCIIVVSFYYIVSSLSMNTQLKTVSSGNFIVDVMKFGSLLFAALSVLFLLYTNSFIMKRRKKELGLYHILGLEKKHIRKVLTWESAITSFCSIASGLIIGVVANQFVTAILSKMIGTKLPFSGAISGPAVVKTIITFVIIFLLSFLYNLRQIHVANPVELLKGGQLGEKEPKAKGLLAGLGLGLLLCGYTLSFLVNNPEKDSNMMLGAVVCVLVATYLLFIAVSIQVLKLLQQNEHFYYKSKNFTLISGMLYRMKQNALGLSNICILSTATLLIMTTTVSLYFGINNTVANELDHDISINAPVADKDKVSKLFKSIDKNINKHSLKRKNVLKYTGGKFAEDLDADGKFEMFFLMRLKEYNHLTRQNMSLSKDEVLIFSEDPTKHSDTLTLGKKKLSVKEYLKKFPIKNNSAGIYGQKWLYIVSPKDGLLADKLSRESNLYYEFDLTGKDQDKSNFSYAISKEAERLGIQFESRSGYHDDLMVRFGGLLFLGMLISIILFMETALSIFYKQISEGYDDQTRFKILKKIGMSQKEIRNTIRRQILIVFFSPLVIALLHLCVALPLVMKLMKIAFMDSWAVTLGSSAVSATVFILIYGAVFLLTERTYRKIVAPSKQ